MIMDFSKIIDIEIPEGKVTKIEDSQGTVLWSGLADPNVYAYGIRWNHNVPDSQATTACERIGNLELHKTLPIQSKFACCVHQGTTIQYWCNKRDTRFRRLSRKVQQYYCNYDTYYIQIPMLGDINVVPASTLASQFNTYNIGTIDDCRTPSGRIDAVISISDTNLTQQQSEEVTLFNTTYKYLYMWIKIIYTDTEGVEQTNVARVEYVDTAKKIAYLAFEDSTKVNATIQALQNEDVYTNGVFIELGSSLNGYDGEVSVYTPKFYIWSVDNDGTNNEVWQSEKKCVDYAREVKAHLIGISRCPVLSIAMNDDKWGWLNTLSNNTSVSVVNYQPNLRGGGNGKNSGSDFDHYLGDNNFRTMLGKAATDMSLDKMRTYTQKIEGSQVLYYQIWNAIVWCYFIEYADFDVKKAFNSNLTDEGYHQGGLGNGLITINNWREYNYRLPNVPVDYTLSIGNNTGIITNPSHSFSVKSEDNSTWGSWTMYRITATIDSTNSNIVNITSIPRIYNDWMIYSTPIKVGGTHKYKIEGLTGGQTVVFKRQQGNLTITTDGEYDVNWGSNYDNRNIIFGLVQKSCNIKITILSSPAITYTFTQLQLNVPCYRGFNTFWYGDVSVLLENLISTISDDKRHFYFTDNPNNFSSNIYNKEHSIYYKYAEDNWAKNIKVGKIADLIIDKTSNNPNYLNSYRYDGDRAQPHSNLSATEVGGDANLQSKCGLAFMESLYSPEGTSTSIGFVKCYIID
mgnify:FL=1